MVDTAMRAFSPGGKKFIIILIILLDLSLEIF